MLDFVRTQLRETAVQYLGQDLGCHRLDHTMRVVANARRLAVSEPTANADVVEAAAWLHDIGRSLERERRMSHAKLSAELAEPLLPGLGFSAEDQRLILDAIADHRFSEGRVPASVEGRILQDADRLDALGAIGIARTFAESHARELYNTDDPFTDRRTPDDARYAIDHFFTKLLRLPETLHTREAQYIAQRRVQYMRGFLNEFAAELTISDSVRPNPGAR